jgi:hypothetical protein
MFSLAIIVSILFVGQSVARSSPGKTECKCIPGDACWPSTQDWADFNATIGGRLVVPDAPLASVCHNPYYDEKSCKYVQKEWTSPWLQ